VNAIAPAILTLAWRPLLDPLSLDMSPWFWLVMIVPLAAAIAVVYKTLKLEDLRRLPVEATRLTVLIVAAMALAGAMLWALTELV
jgi:hypothetical protein